MGTWRRGGHDLDVRYRGKTVVLCPGTFMKGLVHVGWYATRPEGRGIPIDATVDSLRRLGFSVGRLKPAPPRLDAKTIDFSKTVRQRGRSSRPVFLRHGGDPSAATSVLHDVHERRDPRRDPLRLSRSPLYSGVIKESDPVLPLHRGQGRPVSGKERHQVFLEPEGLKTAEYYPNGSPRACRTTSS